MITKNIQVSLAIPIGDKQMQCFRITGTSPIKDGRMQELQIIYRGDSQAIFDTLLSSLPGGTLSRLYALFAAHYVNDLAIAQKTAGI